MEQKWIQAWGMSHAGMSLLGYRGNGRTFRLTVHSAIAGEQIRLSLSNRFSNPLFRYFHFKYCMGSIYFHIIKDMVIGITD